MKELRCPNCGATITVDEGDYIEILQQVKNAEFEKEVKERLELEKDKLLKDKDLAVNAMKFIKEKQIDKLTAENEQLKKDSSAATELAVIKAKKEQEETINSLKEQVLNLSNKVENAKKEAQLSEAQLKTKYENQIVLINEDLKRWKEYRVGDSTKDLGESLEQYCQETFEEMRADAYPNAYFEKDNEVKEGGKADFIFRDFTDDNIEYCSIIFDMKNEKDTTATKHKNIDFLEKLDADRKKKGCEYAVLVSVLESDSKLYNRGIVDMSHKYPKMFVIRPQFLMAFIGLVRNMSLKNIGIERQIKLYERENIDLVNFENAVKAVADKITTDYEKADKIYDTVEKMCDDMIKRITTFKDSFRVARDHIGAAQNQIENLSIRKLTKNNPTMKQKFEDMENKS